MHARAAEIAERIAPWAFARTARVAVLIPCLNESHTIAKVVFDFREALPDAEIYVFDNGSTDDTAARAAEAGAIVRTEPRPGKGHVVRRMFADVDADLYLLVDGDATYDADAAPQMLGMMQQQNLDMVVGCRESEAEAAYRAGHRLGNAMLTGFLARVFGRGFSDILSGYRVMSRRFVKTFPCLSSGFEIETEIAVHTLTLGLPFGEVRTLYGSRPEGSTSKLRTFSDGWRILGTMINLLRQEKPAQFFGGAGAIMALAAMLLAIPLVRTYALTGLVPRFPTAILCTGLMITALLTLCCGLILDSVSRSRMEARRLAYLRWNAPET
ncbi:MAG TPA: glycosyltransferase family 2 protein [Caulobacteraceae bacterium]|nr:glycosyltransferase family 2 protein [Caulobacteraceae bacterium]